MQTRLNMAKAQPEAYRVMGAVDKYVGTTGIDNLHLQMIKIRASQINGCAWCVNIHTHDARQAGETEQRIYLMSVWKEAGAVFTEEEQLLLGMTEEITLIHTHGLSDDLYNKAIALWSEEKTAQVIMAIVTINAWNRIGVALNMHPPLRTS